MGVTWYGVLVASGIASCLLLAHFIARKRGCYRDMVLDVILLPLILAIILTRAYYVIFDIIGGSNTFGWWFSAPSNGFWWRVFRVWEGGLAIYGGMIGAIIGGIIVTKVMLPRKKNPAHRIKLWQLVDIAFCVFLLGLAIGRWGNFANQEAYGNLITNPSWQWFPFGVRIDRGGGNYTWHQATFFYEFLLNISGLALLLFLYNGKRKSFDGFIFSVFCIWYGTGRFFIESLRQDSLFLIPDVIRVSQVVSAAAVLFGIGFIIFHIYKARSVGKKPFIFVPEDQLCYDYYRFEKSMLALKFGPIGPVVQPSLEGTSIEYDGTPSTVGLDRTGPFELGGTTTATEAGTYVATVKLTDNADFVWTDGTRDTISLEWSITPSTASDINVSQDTDAVDSSAQTDKETSND